MVIPRVRALYNLRSCSEFSLFTLKSRLAISGEVNSSLVTRGAAVTAAAAAAAATAVAAAARALFQSTKATNTATHCDGCLVVCSVHSETDRLCHHSMDD